MADKCTYCALNRIATPAVDGCDRPLRVGNADDGTRDWPLCSECAAMFDAFDAAAADEEDE